MANDNYSAVIAALDTNNLNFDAVMRPVAFLGEDGQYHETNMFTPVRSDNGTLISNHTFTSVYRPIQNRDAFKIISDISALADVEFRNVGCWGNGAGVYAQIAMGDDIRVGDGDDRVGRYLSVVNAHDGSRGCSIIITPLRFFCQNQIAPAINGAYSSNTIFSVRHNSLAESRLKILADNLKVCNGIFIHTADIYNRLAAKTIDRDYVREAISRCLPFVPNEEDPENGTAHWEKMATGMLNRFESADNGNVEKMTAWNLYNAIQGTFQHDARNTANKNFSILCGGIAGKSREALDNVYDLVEHGFSKTSSPEFDRAFAKLA
jgi:phage/plasmid-like protein (TIGR03299 family)